MKLPYAIGSVPSLSGHAIAYRWRSLPRVRRHRVSKPQGSSERVLPWQIPMDQLIFASLSHIHYWYEVGMLNVPAVIGNGQKRELPVLFGQKRMYPENKSGRECCWPSLIGQHPLSPVFGQKRPGTPGNSSFAQLPSVFDHFMFLSGGLLECSNRSTWATRKINQSTAKLPGLYTVNLPWLFTAIFTAVRLTMGISWSRATIYRTV